jgi:6-phosphofructokinase 2
MSILTLTMNPCIDKSSSIDNVVAERKLRCERPTYEPGGGGINVCRAIHKLGGSSTAFYLAGGPMGQMLDMLLAEEGIATDKLEIAGPTRESLVIYEKATEQQYRFSMPGPDIDDKMWKESLERISSAYPRPSYIVASGSLPPGAPDDFYARLAKMAKKQDARLILDTTGPPLCMAVEEGVYLIKPNLRELKALSDKDIENEAQQVALARLLIQKGQTEAVVVSLGAAGALLVWDKGCERLRAPTVPIKSKVGAGDSMVGGLVLALDRGETLIEAVRFGVAAGAAAVMTPGTELCRREDMERLYADMSASD